MTTALAPSEPAHIEPVGGKSYPIRSVDDGPMAAYLDRTKFEQAWSISQMLAKSELLPAHFKGRPENCFIAVQLAARMRMDPFAVMQACYIVQGKPGFEAKFVIALINSSGLFDGPLSFQFSGTPNKSDWTCTCSAIRRDNGEKVSIDFRYAVAEAEGWVSKGGSKWKTMPEQMMRYRSAAFFARVYCPEVIMGVQTRDEIEDIEAVEVVERQPLKRPQPKQIESNVTPTQMPEPEPQTQGPVMQDVIAIVESLTPMKPCREAIYAALGLNSKRPPAESVSPEVLAHAESLRSFVAGVGDEDKPAGVDAWKATIQHVIKANTAPQGA